MDPTTIILAGVTGARALGNMAAAAGKATVASGIVAHNWLKNAMPAGDPWAQGTGKEDFSLPDITVPHELGYKIKLIEETTRALGDEPGLRMVRGIIEQISDESYKVLFVGHSLKGKSALLNKLLGRDILKVGTTETTKILAWLLPGGKDNEVAWYHDAADDLHAIPLEQVKEIPDDPPVFNVYVSVDVEILRHGAILIDTPGLEASGNAAALTNEAIKNADAVILVMDNFPAEAHDRALVETLRKEGKGDRLFVVMNKMDLVSDDGRRELVGFNMSWLSDMGIPARIFPLSRTDDPSAVDNDFLKFREALVEYIDKDRLQSARYASVAGRIKNTAAYLRERCEEMAEISRQKDSATREAMKANAREWTRRVESSVNEMLQKKQGEIKSLKRSVLDKWGVFLGALKDETSLAIQNASDEQLNQSNQLLGDIQVRINRFLLDEFSAAERQVRDNLRESFSGPQLPVPQQEGRMQVNVTRWDRNIKIPSEFASVGLMAYTVISKTSQGIIATIGAIPQLFLLFTLSPVINKLFEQVLQVGLKIGSSAFRAQLQNKINEQWPNVDEKARDKINEYFDALSQQVGRMGREIVYTEKNSLQNAIARADEFASADRISELEKFQRQLGDISE